MDDAVIIGDWTTGLDQVRTSRNLRLRGYSVVGLWCHRPRYARPLHRRCRGSPGLVEERARRYMVFTFATKMSRSESRPFQSTMISEQSALESVDRTVPTFDGNTNPSPDSSCPPQTSSDSFDLDIKRDAETYTTTASNLEREQADQQRDIDPRTMPIAQSTVHELAVMMNLCSATHPALLRLLECPGLYLPSGHIIDSLQSSRHWVTAPGAS